MTIDSAEQKSDVVRIRGIAAEMKENNRHTFAPDADGADELPQLFVRDAKPDQLLDVFEKDVFRIKQGEITRRPPREDFPIRAGRPAASLGGDDDVWYPEPRGRRPSALRCDLIDDREQPPEHFLPRNARRFHALRVAQALADDAPRLFAVALRSPFFALHLAAKEGEHAPIKVRDGAHLRFEIGRQLNGEAHGFY